MRKRGRSGVRGVAMHSSGYILVKKPDHPDCYFQGYIFEHRLIAEQALGRRLRPGEIVHHINGTKTDNRSDNLAVVTRSEHSAIHNRERKILFDMEHVAFLFLSGMTSSDIAKKLGCSTSVIWCRLLENGIKPGRKRRTKAWKAMRTGCTE